MMGFFFLKTFGVVRETLEQKVAAAAAMPVVEPATTDMKRHRNLRKTPV